MKDDEVRPDELALEALWKAQKGVDPETGKAWLTPRMERIAAATAAAWEQRDRHEEQIALEEHRRAMEN